MIVIPAVDIKGGRCVRLLQGEMDKETVFADDPSSMAKKWADLGAELIHVVDLDGAMEKKPMNLTAISRILKAVSAPVQVGGGIRDLDTMAQYFDLGVSRVVIGTEAIRRPEVVEAACRKYPGRIVVGIDARQGKVAIEGWKETTDTLAVDLARRFEDSGVAAINFTDILRDGMETGPNIEQTKKLAEAVSIPVVASGGVSRLSDIRSLKPLEAVGVMGVITGRALYSGALDFTEAVKVATGEA